MPPLTVNEVFGELKKLKRDHKKISNLKGFLTLKCAAGLDNDIIAFFERILNDPVGFKDLSTCKWNTLNTKKNVISSLRSTWNENFVYARVDDSDKHNKIAKALGEFYVEVVGMEERIEVVDREDNEVQEGMGLGGVIIGGGGGEGDNGDRDGNGDIVELKKLVDKLGQEMQILKEQVEMIRIGGASGDGSGITKDDVDRVINENMDNAMLIDVLNDIKLNNPVDIKKYNQYKRNATFLSHVNKMLKKAFKNDKLTISVLKKLYVKVINPTPFVHDILPEFQRMDIQDLMIDNYYKQILQEYDVFKDNYPFVLIEIPEMSKFIQYPIYRYIAQLPNYSTLNPEEKLPTVDHISHNTLDNRVCNLRYCTQTQNARNMCKKRAKYHGVNSDNTSMLPCKTPIMIKTKIWFIMFDNYLMSVADKVQGELHNKSVIDINACKTRKHLDDIQKFILEIDSFIKAVGVITEESSSCDAYTHKMYISDIPKEDLASPYLKRICNAWPTDKMLNKGGVHFDFVFAILHDFIKIKDNKSFCHVNLLKKPKAKATVSIPGKMRRPEEILNMYSNLEDYKVPEDNQMFIGHDKTLVYSYENRRIVAHIVARNSIEKNKMVFELVEDTPDLIIRSPFVKYKSKKGKGKETD